MFGSSDAYSLRSPGKYCHQVFKVPTTRVRATAYSSMYSLHVLCLSFHLWCPLQVFILTCHFEWSFYQYLPQVLASDTRSSFGTHIECREKATSQIRSQLGDPIYFSSSRSTLKAFNKNKYSRQGPTKYTPREPLLRFPLLFP